MRRPARSALRRPDRAGPSRSTTPHKTAPSRSASEIGALLQAAVGRHQAGQLPEAEALYRQVLALDPAQPDALNLLGILAYQVGQADAALPLVEQAVNYRPSSAAYRLNLGNVLLALGRRQEAISAYRRATTLDPADAGAHYNLGNALLQVGEQAAGIASLRRAIQLRPDHAEAHYNLGNALREAGQPADARRAYEAALRLQPGFVDAHSNLGILLHEQGEHAAARRHFDQALALQPDHQGALRGLVAIEEAAGRHAETAALLLRVVQGAPDDLDATRHLVRSLQQAGQADVAMSALVAALDRFPQDRELLQRLIEALQDISTPIEGAAADTVRAGMLTIVTSDCFEIQKLATPIARLIVGAPEYPALLATVQAGVDPLAAGIPLPSALTDEPAVLASLQRVAVCLPELELMLTALRRSLLPYGEAVASPFFCALAGAAFLAEYAWLVLPDEAERLAVLQAGLAALLADPASDLVTAEPRLLLASMYGRLGRLPGAERLAEIPLDRWSAPFVQVIREQVLETLEERRLAAALPRLTPIDDAVSQTVRAMYEENPYPRWRAARFRGVEPLLERFRALCPGEQEPDWPSPLPVLIAGAGSGQHPIQSAMRMPEADVLGVDLSLTSLGYGARMAAQIGVPNLRLAQADILALDTLDERFALIECSGVLHHLADPMAGWRVLRRLLRPDGLMQISLYSEIARAAVVAARELVAAQGIPSTPDGIRAIRRQIIDLPPDHPTKRLTRFWDFYSESGFRDLAMHVQEHRFTVPQLAAALDALDLRFLGFDLKAPVRAAFVERFPQPGALLDLDAWDQFEHENPDTFAAMYHLWCRPR